MSKKSIIPLILALGLTGALVFCVTSVILAGGGGPPQLCETGYDGIEGPVTWSSEWDTCEHKTGDYVRYRYYDYQECEWVTETTSIYWSASHQSYWYTIYWPAYACTVKVKGCCGVCSGCSSDEYSVFRNDGTGWKILGLVMRYRCNCD